jgi:hypothetical protein
VITTQFHALPDVGWYAGAYQLTKSVLLIRYITKYIASNAVPLSASLQPLTGKIYTFFSAKVRPRIYVMAKKEH